MNPIRRMALLTALALLSIAAQGQNTIVKPKEIHDVLVNPGIGFTTFSHFNGDHFGKQKEWNPEQMQELLLPNGDLKYNEYPPTSIAYFRWYWDEFEPEQGKYRWDIIDGAIENAQKNGQKLAFRIMPQNGVPKAPEWYRKIAKGFVYENGKSWMPDYEDPLFMEHYGRLIAELGERYDGHPGVDHVDMGVVGRWGEWHTSQTGHPMPSMQTQKTFVDLYLNAFQKSPLLMLIGGGEAFAHAVANGTGWRADCLGDMGGFSKNWNHMEDLYPIEVSRADAQNTWKRAPVIFESCWTMKEWVENGWDVKEIFDRALRYHTSAFNNKSSTVPEEAWGYVNEFLKKMGYRFVLRRLQFADDIRPGQTLSVQALWENIGVAPVYQSFTLAYQLKQDDTEILHTSPIDPRSWLPGYHLTTEDIQIPQDIQPGNYTLRVALLDPKTQKPAIRLAIEGRESDGWYSLCRVEVRGK